MIQLYKHLQRMVTKETALEPLDDPMWGKRLEWLEDNAPELLEDHLRSPRKLKKHLDKTVLRAWSAIYSMMEERGLPRYEAEAIALTDIVYPETQADYEDSSENEVDQLSPKTREQLKRFRKKYLGY